MADECFFSGQSLTKYTYSIAFPVIKLLDALTRRNHQFGLSYIYVIDVSYGSPSSLSKPDLKIKVISLSEYLSHKNQILV